jgi:crotonobetaine/carnitine-CoA ligase
MRTSAHFPTSEWTLVHALRRSADRPNDPRFDFLGQRTLSHRDLDRESDRLATGLAALGLGRGDRIALFAANSPEFLTTVIAIHKRGAVVVPLNVDLTGGFLEHQLVDSRPDAIVLDEALIDRVEAMPEAVRRFRATIVIGAAAGERTTLAELAATPARADAVSTPGPADMAAILYTSGTTGPAKGVELVHGHCYLFGALQADAQQLMPADTYYIALPMFHVNALFMAIGGCLVVGASAAIARRFSASQWLEEIQQSGATVTNAVGVMAEFVLRQPPSAGDHQHALRSVMAIPVGATWASEFEHRFGVRLVQVYGMTECNIVSFSDPMDPLVPGCTGPVVRDLFDVAIVDPDDDRELDPGQVGEIVVRPKVPWTLMQGYFDRPQDTVAAWRNLWFHTGDAGHLDERDRLTYVDRLKDCIRRRGENISAYQVEQVLTAYPSVAEAAVVATPAESGGEDEILALVVADGVLSELDLLDWARNQLPRFAVPRYVEIVDHLDKTATGKIRKDVLRQRGLTAAAIDSAQLGRSM